MNNILELYNESITLERNQFLGIKGQINSNIYFIETGSLKVFVLDNDEEQIVRLGYKGNWIAFLDSFLTDKPTSFHIQAIKKTKLKVINKAQISNYLDNNNDSVSWTNILENLVHQQLEREIDILTSSPKERYRRVLERSPQLFQEIPLRHIANYLRMSPETLSRLKKLD